MNPKTPLGGCIANLTTLMLTALASSTTRNGSYQFVVAIRADTQLFGGNR